MADKTKTIKVVVDAKSADRALEVLRGNFKATADVVKETGEKVDKTMKDIKKSVESTESSLGFLQRAFKAAFVVNAISSFGQQLYDINSKFQGFIATMTVVTGSVESSRKEFEFITNVANKYGVSIQSLTSTYAKLAAAGKDSALTHGDLHKIFEAMAMASNVLHLSMEETRLVFYALQQMVSKGNVTMEELRRQLAEKFPGAVNLMSQALEVPVKELEKMIKSGQVAADQALPKFAEMILRAFGPASQYAVKSLNAEVTRLHNAWFTFIQTMAEKSNILPAVIEVVNWLTKALNDNGSAAVAIGNQLADMIKIVGDWVKNLTAEDIRKFFSTVENALAAIIPFLQIGATALAGWGMILRPLIEEISNFGRLMSEEKWTAGLVKLTKWMAAATGNFTLMNWAVQFEEKLGKVNTVAHNFIGVMPNVTEETTKYGKTLNQQINDLETEYKASLRSIDVKTKNRNATKELNDMEIQRRNLFAIAGNPDAPEQGRINAYRILLSQEKEYTALQKESNQERRAATTAYNQLLRPAEQYIAALLKEARALSLTQEQLDELNKKELVKGLGDKDRTRILEDMARAQEWVKRARADVESAKEAEKRVKDSQSELDNLEKAVQAQQEYNDKLGMTTEQIRKYEIAQLEAALAVMEMNYVVDENSKLTMAEYELLGKRIERLKELIQLKKAGDIKETAIEKANKSTKEAIGLWKDLDRYTDKFFLDLIVNGKSAFDSLMKDLKLFAAELLSLAAKKFIFGIAGAIIGGDAGNSLTSTAVNAGTNTVAGRVYDAGTSYLAQTAFGTAVTGAYSSFVAGYQGATLAAGLAGPTTAGASGFTGMGAWAGSLGATGWGLIIVAAIAVVAAIIGSRGGGPKFGGSSFSSYAADGTYIGNASVYRPTENGQLLSETGANAQAREATDLWSKSFVSTVKKFGGTTGPFSAGLAFNTDPQGDAPGMVRGQLQMNGKTIFDYQNSDVDDKDIEKEIGLMMKRMTIAGLQNSDLPNGIKEIFNSVNAETATEEQLDKVMKMAQAFQYLIDLTSEFTEDQLKAVDLATASSWELYQAQGEALSELADTFDGTEESMAALTAATETYRKSQFQLLVDIKKIAKELEGMFDTTRRSIQMGGMSNEEKYNFIMAETEGYVAQLKTATDPSEINRLSKLINSNYNEAFGLLSPEQQRMYREKFLKSLDDLEFLTNSRLNIARQTILDDSADNPDSPLNKVAAKLQAWADTIVPASANIRDGGNAILAASGRPVNVRVTINGEPVDNEVDSPVNGG